MDLQRRLGRWRAKTYQETLLGALKFNLSVASFAANQVEQHLAVDKHTDVYGIYFNFASDSLRPESEPVLHEIAKALQAHPEWKLVINGHTDNIGGDALNLDLSRRRAMAVRKALVDQYKIEDSRLTTNGFGASQPKESNDSDRGGRSIGGWNWCGNS